MSICPFYRGNQPCEPLIIHKLNDQYNHYSQIKYKKTIINLPACLFVFLFYFYLYNYNCFPAKIMVFEMNIFGFSTNSRTWIFWVLTFESLTTLQSLVAWRKGFILRYDKSLIYEFQTYVNYFRNDLGVDFKSIEIFFFYNLENYKIVWIKDNRCETLIHRLRSPFKCFPFRHPKVHISKKSVTLRFVPLVIV